MNGATCTDAVNSYTCGCADGYTGTHCETDVNECASTPCMNGATCTDAVNSYTCGCADGYTGTHCETDVDECASTPCMNGATCTDAVNSYTCGCADGYTGTHCETDVNECASTPCMNGATCTDAVNSYTCGCADGYTGTHCETDVNECASTPCMNGATCTDAVNSYTCGCADGYTGTHCETDVNECASTPCMNGATCTDAVNSYTCGCADGYTGTHCETDVNECASTPCMNGATCTDAVNSYTCGCADGYTGTHCETECSEGCLNDLNPATELVCLFAGGRAFQNVGPVTEKARRPYRSRWYRDIDECASNPCMNGATCTDAVNRHSCACVDGYTGNNCETDIDECASNPCMNGATCTEDVNQFTCACNNGYTGVNCETDIDECSSNPCVNGATCVDDVNGYTCSCVDGFTGVICETDIDECSSSPCVNGATCSDYINRYACTCAAGYTGVNCETDINECVSNPCQNGATCAEDGIYAYTCACASGYTGVNCETDINECASTPCMNGATCTDAVNSYSCACVDGYTGTHCETDIDECGSSPCINGASCTEGVNTYTCVCVAGYTGINCETDIDECSSSPCLNAATCNDVINGYTCSCMDGYTDTLCQTDINECSSNPCLNSAACSDVVNGYTCACLPGYTGINCETDVNECGSNPCMNGANCTSSINLYTCSCVDGYTGINCETEIDECGSNPCLNGATCTDAVNTYTCACVNGYTGINCETEINECISSPCPDGSTCVDEVGKFTCTCPVGRYYEPGSNKCLLVYMSQCVDDATCVDGRGLPNSVCLQQRCVCGSNFIYESVYGTCQAKGTDNPCTNTRLGDPCNSDGGSIHSCHFLGESKFNCICATGYETESTGTICKDINECQLTDNECSKQSERATCVNTMGDYVCLCKPGYIHASSADTKVCVDVDECALDTHTCDHSSRALCNNTVGGYHCSCLTGYEGDGHSCIEVRYIVPDFSSHERVARSAEYSPYIFTKFAVPIYEKVASSFYVTRSGLILATSVTQHSQTSGIRTAFPNPGKSLDTFTLSLDAQELALVAPFWSNMKLADSTKPERGVYYQQYNKGSADADTKLATISEEITKRFHSSFVAQWMLVVTWHEMEYPSNPNRTASFQTIITTDYINTYTKTTYADRGMKWQVVLDPAMLPSYPARVGTLAFSSKGRQYSEYPYSALDVRTAGNEVHVAKIQRIDAVSESDVTYGGAQSSGQFYYRLSENDPGTFVHAGRECSNWAEADIAFDTNDGAVKIDEATAGKCPCSRQQMDYLQYSEVLSDRITQGIRCWTMLTLFVNDGDQKHTPTCCYDINDSLVVDPELTNGMNLYRRFSGARQLDDDKYYSLCCGEAYLAQRIATPELCALYKTRRPVSTCKNFRSGKTSNCLGDPHISTLDGFTFTFNGLGEYNLLSSAQFQLQGRTSVVQENGVDQPATAFTSFAAQQLDPASDIVEYRLNSAKTGIDVLRNKVASDIDLKHTTATWSNVRLAAAVQSNNKWEYSMAFTPSQISVKVTVASGMLKVTTVIPGDLTETLKGLFGSNNDNVNDDVSYPDGTIHPKGTLATEAELFEYGKSWQNTEATSLFAYTSGTWSDYTDSSFTPLFFNKDLAVMFPDEARRLTAVRLCYNSSVTSAVDPSPEIRRACYFDYKVTNSEEAGRDANTGTTDYQKEKSSVENHSPTVLNGDVALEVQLGQTYSSLMTVQVQDSDGDSVTFSVTSDSPQGLAIDKHSGTLSWVTVPDMSLDATRKTVKVVITDGKVDVLWVPNVKFCKCENGGKCNFAVDSAQTLTVVPCECALGYGGDFCQLDIDGCADQPCFSGVLCTDVAAPDLSSHPDGFLCGTCPIGLSGDGSSCIDKDECLDPTTCGHKCTNLPGGYECSCQDGYLLGPDSSSCIDIDECATGVVSCPAHSVCVNKKGSYECQCFYGYTKNGINECEEINECLLDNNCKQLCVDQVGGYNCACPEGFKLAGDLISCESISECSVEEKKKCDPRNSETLCSKDAATGDIKCICPKGYNYNEATLTCDDLDECATATSLCKLAVSECINKDGDYECRCKAGYTLDKDGRTCIDIDECALNQHNCTQTCVNVNGGFTCDCLSGYVLEADGRSCRNFNECSVANECDKLYGTCIDVYPTSGKLGYKCECKNGYVGDGFICTEVNECLEATRGGCEQGCVNKQGGYLCFCGSGFVLSVDGKTCTDINECANDADNECYSTDLCTNNRGGYTCGCPNGLKIKADGVTCEAEEKCSNDYGCSYQCAILDSKYTCLCPSGQRLAEDGKLCQDINECSDSSLHNCLATNFVKCVNLDHGFQCVCINNYYVQIEKNRCIDADECLATNSCPKNSHCINKEPGYQCVCAEGYKKFGHECIDVDECVLGTHTCDRSHGICKNTDGGFTCTCKAGYKSDGINCPDIDECGSVNDCDMRPGVGVCTNTPGSYTCGCAAGYELAPNKKTCNDIDECMAGTHGCQHTCRNTQGSYLCLCVTGFRLAADQKSCIVETPCTNKLSCVYECAKIHGVDTCVCPPGKLLVDSTKCEDINECDASPPCDPAHGFCVNTIGSFMCTCKDNYKLGANNLCKVTEDEVKRGLLFDIRGIKLDMFAQVFSNLQTKLASSLNAHCNHNTTTVSSCCKIATKYVPSQHTQMDFIHDTDIVQGGGYPIQSGGDTLTLLLVFKYQKTNALCTAAAQETRRKKRGATGVILSLSEDALNQELLQAVLNNPTMKAALKDSLQRAILNVFGVSSNITVTDVEAATQAPFYTSPPKTTEATTTGDNEPAVEAWVIVVAVFGAIVGVIIIIIAVLLLIKRPTLVHPIAEQRPREQDEPAPTQGPSSMQAHGGVDSISSVEDMLTHPGDVHPRPALTLVDFPEPPVVPRHTLPPIEHPSGSSTMARIE
ncbi:Mucin-like protein [Lamellibrachia satsuma]|nr:Mucin-like protein [Lamellibrachia satsuma]